MAVDRDLDPTQAEAVYSESDMAEGDAQELTSDRVADLVEYMVASLVDNPDGIIIDVTDNDDNSSLIEVRVDPDDIGKVIGRHGRVIKSIRSLARACAARDNAYAEVEIIG